MEPDTLVMNEQQEVEASVEEAKEKLRAEGGKIAAKANETWDAMKTKASDLRDSAESGVRENPLPILAGAVLTGLTLGLLLRGLEQRNEHARLLDRSFLSRWGTGLAASLGFLAGRAHHSRFSKPIETAREMIEDKVSGKRFHFGRPFRNAWRRFSH